MMKKITSKKLASNVLISVGAQIISLLVSVILNLFVPKFIDEMQYSYWQTYILYISNVVVLHFGLLDGLLLRYSQFDYEELDKPRIRSQFQLLLIITGAIALACCIIAFVVTQDEMRILLILIAVGIITKNLVLYSSYTFQITNRINKYAVLIIAQKLVYGFIVVALLILRVNDFYWYCMADLIGDAAAIVLSAIINRGMYFGRTVRLKETVQEAGLNISSGIILMLANWSAALIVSGAKMIVQWRWRMLLFGKVSFAFSVTNIFLTFVTAVSVVLFPSLRRMEQDKLPEMYKNIRNILSPLLFIAMLLYFPGCWLLELWLPAYTKSLAYLGILLPMIVFSSKVSLLTNNYLKAYRKERAMLAVNALSVALGVIAFTIIAYVFGNLNALLICIVAVIIFNSVVSEIIVMRTIRVRVVKDFFIEIAMSAGFIAIVTSPHLTRWWGCLVYAGVLAVYCLLNYKSIAALVRKLLRKEKKRETPALAENAPEQENIEN